MIPHITRGIDKSLPPPIHPVRIFDSYIEPSVEPKVLHSMARSFSTRLITLFLILTDLQIQCWAFGFHQREICATGPPKESLKKAHQDLSVLESKHDSASEYTERQITNQIEIDTWFHIVCSEANAELVSDTMIASQVSIRPAA